MMILRSLILGFLSAIMLGTVPSANAKSCPDLLNQTYPRLQDEKPISLCNFSGDVLLVVNTASKCGYTNQYEGLEGLHAEFSGQGFSVLGFPSSDFGGQEFGDNAKIAEFCHNTFGVKFPMFGRSHVVGPNANTLYQALSTDSGEPPRWNFHKYLIGRDGKVIASFPSNVRPSDPKLRQAINKALAVAH